MLNHNLYLLGFMGSGKSHVGNALAKDLKVLFIDLDVFIETRSQTTISEIFATKGEAHFRRLEASSLRQLKTKKAVIALGGGTPCFFENDSWIRENGDSFFLDVSTPVLIERLLGEIEQRPLLKGKNKEELEFFIQEKLEGRRAFYTQATHTIKAIAQAQIILEIKEKLKQ